MSLPPNAVLDGSWEQPGRNPLVGAIAGVILCGAVYSTLGGIVGAIIGAAESLRDPGWFAGGRLVDFLIEYYRRFQVSILVLSALGECAVFFALGVALVRRWHSSRPFAYLSFRRPNVLAVALAGAGGIAIVPLAEIVNRWSAALLPPLRELASGEAALLAARTPWHAALVVGAVALTPAVCEETLFRGWLLGTLRRRMRLVPAIAVQSVLFALFHMSPLSIVALALVGLYLGWIFERTGTLAASVAAHGLYNGTIIAVSNLRPRWLVDASGDFSLAATCGALAGFALVVVLLELGTRRRA